MKAEYFIGANNTARAAFLMLAGSNVMLVIVLLVVLVSMSGRETVVRMPPPATTGEEIIIGQSWANAAYMESWAWWVANMVGNINSENIADSLVMLNRIMDDRLQDAMREDLRASVENMRIQGFRLSFEPQRVVHHENGRTYVIGHLTETPVRGEPNRTRFTYDMQFTMRFGLPRLTNFRAYEGDPQTRNR